MVKKNNTMTKEQYNELKEVVEQINFLLDKVSKLAKKENSLEVRHELDNYDSILCSNLIKYPYLFNLKTKEGLNLGMTASQYGLNKTIEMFLKNEKVCLDKDVNGSSIGFHLVMAGNVDMALKALDNEKLAVLQDKAGYNMAMVACNYKEELVVLKALDYKTLEVQQNENGYNIGMLAGINGLEKSVCKALLNQKASLQKDVHGKTIGMYAIENQMKYAGEIALKNREASCLQDNSGKNMLMKTAIYSMPSLYEIASQNVIAGRQKDNAGKNAKYYYDLYIDFNKKNKIKTIFKNSLDLLFK